MADKSVQERLAELEAAYPPKADASEDTTEILHIQVIEEERKRHKRYYMHAGGHGMSGGAGSGFTYTFNFGLS